MDMGKGRLAAESSWSSERNLFLETNDSTLRHQLLHKVVETIKERAHRLRNDTRSLGDQITDALVHLRSVVSEQPPPSSSDIAARQQAELHAGLAAMRAAVDAGMARVEASYRSQGDEVDRLRAPGACT